MTVLSRVRRGEEKRGEDERQKGRAVGEKKRKKTELLSCCGTLKQSSEAFVPSVMRNA